MGFPTKTWDTPSQDTDAATAGERQSPKTLRRSREAPPRDVAPLSATPVAGPPSGNDTQKCSGGEEAQRCRNPHLASGENWVAMNK